MADWDSISIPAHDWDAISKPAKAPGAKTKPKRNWQDNVTGAMANFNRSIGIGDEMAAGFKTAGDLFTGKARRENLDVAYRRHMAEQRQAEDSFTAEHPNWAALSRGTGIALTAAVPAGGSANIFRAPMTIAGRNVPQAAANMARGAGLAATQAGAYAAVDRGTLAERGAATGRAMTDPLTLALGAGGGALATPRRGKVQAPPAYPTVAELQKKKRDLYDAAHASGFTFDDAAMNALSAKVETEFKTRAGSGPAGKAGMPVANMLTERLKEMARSGNVTLEHLDRLRSDAYAQAVEKGGPDSVVGSYIRREIDALMDSYKVPLIQEARKANTQWMKADEIARRQRSGTLGAASANSGQNVVNAQRAKIRPTIDPLHSSEITNWTPEEAAAVERVVMGSPEANRLRDAGNLLRNPLFGTVGGVAGGFTGGGVGALGVPAMMQLAGRYFRKAAEKVTAQDIDALQRLIAEGRIAPPVVRGPPTAVVSGPAAARLSRAAGVAGGARASGQSAPNIYAQP